MGERSGGGAGRAGSCGKPVLRLAGLSAGRKSGAGAGEIQARRASTQAQSRTSRRGLKPVKFGRDSALAGTSGSKDKNESDCKSDVTTRNQVERLEGVNGQAGSKKTTALVKEIILHIMGSKP